MESRKHRHNSEVRARILSGAAQLFRARGIDGVGIDAVMAEAGLTRGAFYAHFKSKDDLFVAVVRSEHPLLRRLTARGEGDARALWHGLQDVFHAYLEPAHFDAVRFGCSVASLTRDVARGSDAARAAYEAAHGAILAEMARGQGFEADDPALVAALTLAVGAVGTAAATASDAARARILTGARAGYDTLMAPLAP